MPDMDSDGGQLVGLLPLVLGATLLEHATTIDKRAIPTYFISFQPHFFSSSHNID
jgi:hypothetical protein